MATSQQSYKKAVLVETPPDTGNAEVQFDAQQFKDFIFKHGYECYIERRMYCPCININVGQPLADCLNCGGTGRFYINKQASVISCQSMSNRNKYESWSITNLGVVNITARPQDKMGFEDRVTLTELEMYHSEVLQLRYSADNTKIFAFTKYFPIRIFYAYAFAGVNQPLTFIDPSLMQIQDNKIIFNFSTFNALMPVNVSVHYVANPQYMIIDINRDMAKTLSSSCGLPDTNNKTNLPLNYVGRLLHILPDQPNLNGVGLFDNTNYNIAPPQIDDSNNAPIVINVAPPGAGQPGAAYPFIKVLNGTGTFNILATEHMVKQVKGVLLLDSLGHVVDISITIDPATQNVQIVSLITFANYKILIY